MKEREKNIMKDLIDVIAIDGPAASGKSTIASLLAKKLSITYVNTGNMYRAVTLYAMEKGFTPDGVNSNEIITEILKDIKLDYIKSKDGSLALKLNGAFVEESIRKPAVAKNVSFVATIPEVRKWLVKKQRSFAENNMIVMEGRDIGSVVFPHAKYKFFLTASPEIRAKRRLEQDGEASKDDTVATIAKEIAKRDQMDMNRAISPLKQTEDATLIDTSNLSIDEIVEQIAGKIKEVQWREAAWRGSGKR